jgi:hypothetical protein
MDMAVKDTDTPEAFKGLLAIDQDELDAALEQHAEIYHHVSEATAHAIARRDAAKLDFEEAEARAYEALRDDTARKAEKAKKREHVTETLFKHKLRLDPALQKLARRVLHLNAKVEEWVALKDSFYQRSFMLRELTGWVIAHRYDVANEHRVVRDRAELIRQRVGAERRKKRGD